MATFVKFQDFVEQLGLKNHNLNTDTLKVFLTSTTPNVSTHTVYSDLSGGEPTTTGGYTAGGEDIQNVWSETGGTGTMTATDVIWTATGGGFSGSVRYAAVYNDTGATKYLVCYWDYGSAVTPAAGETFKVDFGANVFTIT